MRPRPAAHTIGNHAGALALDEAIRKIEAEAQCLPQVDAPDTAPTIPLRPPEQEVSSFGCQEPAPHGSTPNSDLTSEEKGEDRSANTIDEQFVSHLPKVDREQSKITIVEVVKDFRQFVRNLDAGPHASKKAWQSFAQGNSLKPVPQEAKTRALGGHQCRRSGSHRIAD
jgi:hypothetical protein